MSRNEEEGAKEQGAENGDDGEISVIHKGKKSHCDLECEVKRLRILQDLWSSELRG